MGSKRNFVTVIPGILLAGWVSLMNAAEEPGDVQPEISPQENQPAEKPVSPMHKPRTREDFERLRAEWDKLSPEEKAARRKAFFEKNGKPMFSRKEFERRCEEFEKISPEERRAKIKEWREKELALRERFLRHLTELRIKEKDGTLSEEEQRRLEHMETLAKRFEKTRHRSFNYPRDRNAPPNEPGEQDKEDE